MIDTINKKIYIFPLVIIVVAALAVIAAVRFLPNDQPIQKVLFLNSSKLLAASTKQIMGMKLANDQAATVSTGLAENMKRLVMEYREQGFIVLNSSAAFTYPEKYDITASFAERLGVEIE